MSSKALSIRGYDLGVPDKADGLHRSVREIKTNQSSQSLNEAGSLTKVARFFFALLLAEGNFPRPKARVFPLFLSNFY